MVLRPPPRSHFSAVDRLDAAVRPLQARRDASFSHRVHGTRATHAARGAHVEKPSTELTAGAPLRAPCRFHYAGARVIGGTIDGKYRIVRLVGRGGMGAVYEGEDLRSGQRVAVKVMHPRSPSDTGDDDQKGRFQREARAAAAIDGEHVARVLDWGTDEIRGAPYIVLEYLQGEDLHALLKRVGALRPDVALRVLAQACLGVQKAHEARVIHRDIKPANLFLARTSGGEVVVKILDFGIAKIRPEREGGETTGLTRTGGMLGSPIYMSPEQARGLKAIDYRTDLWSLGVVLYRALSGHTPHDETEAIGDLIVAICSHYPRPIQELAPWVPAPIAAVAEGALQIQPDDRWPSAAAMLDAMRPLLPGPGGFDLREEMLGPVDAVTRATVAERPKDLLTTLGHRGGVAASVPPRPFLPPPPATPHETGDPVPASTASPSRRERLWPARAAGVAAMGIVAGAVYYGATSPGRAGGGASPPAVVASTDSPASRATPSVAPQVELPRVKLAVAPADAAVEIDGAAARPSDGAVEIQGAVGSVHRVRVSRGALERSVDVTVTDGGASPHRIELDPPHVHEARSPGGAGKPPASAPATAKPLIPDRFE
jgi:serine/threonine protein kinase